MVGVCWVCNGIFPCYLLFACVRFIVWVILCCFWRVAISLILAGSYIFLILAGSVHFGGFSPM